MKLETGYKTDFEVRKEHIPFEGDEGFSVIYLSDLHFNKYSGPMAEELNSKINALNPDIILLGGDYVDSKKGLPHLEKLIKYLPARSQVMAIAGNHDYFLGMKEVKQIMERYHIHWIENDSVTLTINKLPIRIDGSRPDPKNTNSCFKILCLHKPIDLNRFHDHYHLAFAGHLHGCQFVFWKNGQALYPGRLFYKWNILKTRSNSCHYFISKGLGDTLPLRFNCKKDFIFVTVSPSPSFIQTN